MASPALELRVLMGLQAGARMGLAEGRYIVGSGDAVDIVLSGPRIQAEHAALTVARGRASIVPLNGGVRQADGLSLSSETDLAPGQAVDCDGAWIAVASPDTPWPDVAELLTSRAAKAAAANQDSSGPAEPAETKAEERKPAPVPAAPSPPKGASAPALPSGVLLPVAVALCLLLLSAGWLWSRSGERPAAAVAAKPRVDPHAARGAAIRERIAALGMSDRVVAQSSGTTWTVMGSVVDEAERERMRVALAAIRPPPVIRVYTDEETSALVSSIISRSGMPVRFTITGPGKAKLTIAAPTAEAAEQVAQSFREELGGIRELETEFITPAALVPVLQDLVNKAGLGGRIRIAPAGPASPHLTAIGSLNNAEIERWKGVLAEFTRKHGTFVGVQTAFTRLTPNMPFTVRAVVDGENPQVLTTDGDRIFEGGTLKGYRLVAIRELDLVFDGPERVQLARPKAQEAAPRAPAR